MKSLLKWSLALVLLAALVVSLVHTAPQAEADAVFYGDYTDVKKIYDASSCPSMQGLAVGSQYLYAIKIKTDNSRAIITRTDKDTGSMTTFTDASTGYSYFTGLDHANDMAVYGIDSKSHLFIATTMQGANAIIRYRVDGISLTKIASYTMTCGGETICVTAMDVMKVDSSGYIHLITKWGQDIYTGTVHKDSGSTTIAMTKLCTISKAMAYIKGEKLDLTDWVNQGFGYYDNTLFVPLSGPDDQLNRSVVLVYDLANVIAGSTIYPTDSVVFRVTSGAYSALFEIESCDICSGDKKLYFNTNRRITNSDTNHDGVSSFDGYTYSKPAAASFDTVHHFHGKFLPNGGTGTMDIQRIVYNVSTPLSANAYTRTGYTFAGWTAHRLTQNQWYYTNGSDTGWYAEGAQPSGYRLYVYKDKQKVSATSSIYDDTVEFVAQWEPAEYTVTWTVNGQPYTTTTVQYGEKPTAPAYTVPEGSIFSGWTVPSAMPAENLTLDATLTGMRSTVTWIVDGKTTTETYDYGATPTFKGSTDKAPDGCTGYTFTGWDPQVKAVTGDATYTAIYAANTAHTYTAAVTQPTCIAPGFTAYTCTACGDRYTEYMGTLTDWSATAPEGVDDALVESKTQYRFADKQTATSGESSMTGWTQVGSAWDSGTVSTLQYVPSWPGGFSKSSSLYSKYNVTPVSASETASEKVVVNSDSLSGYLYYHWCYADSYYSVAASSGSYTTFHAYYDTTNPSNYVCDTSDMSYQTGHATCSNSDWWFVTQVNTQKYTTYNKLYSYERWSDWSDWSDTPAAASDTRKVETRTLYRYLDTPLGDHSYTDGICSLCGAEDPDYVPPVKDYYLVGYINGADYGCEGDYQNMGQYKFAGGKLVATFDTDSYVFLKAEGNAAWYMTETYATGTSAAFYNTNTGTSEKMFVPGGREITFTLTVNADGSLTLSYVAAEPPHQHSYSKEVTSPTCTEAGFTTYRCGCGDSYTSDPVAALGHSYANGICTRCGASDPDYVAPVTGKVEPKSATLSLEDKVLINLYFIVEDMNITPENVGMLIYNRQPETADVATADTVVEGGQYNETSGRYMVSTPGIPGQYLADSMYLVAYAKDATGSYVYARTVEYSGKKYCTSQMTKGSEELKATCVALMNYGAAAQEYFANTSDYTYETPMNADFAAYQSLVQAYSQDMLVTRRTVDSAKAAQLGTALNGFTKRSVSMSADGDFSINYYFTTSQAAEKVTFYYWTEDQYDAVTALTLQNASGSMEMTPTDTANRYWANFSGIAAKELEKTVFACGVYEVNGEQYCTGVFSYSLGYYCITKAANGDANVQPFAKSIAVYSYYAKQYFAI